MVGRLIWKLLLVDKMMIEDLIEVIEDTQEEEVMVVDKERELIGQFLPWLLKI